MYLKGIMKNCSNPLVIKKGENHDLWYYIGVLILY